MKLVLLSVIVFSVIISKAADSKVADEASAVVSQELVSTKEVASTEKNTLKAESEIPLNLETKKSVANNEGAFFKFILFFAILGTLLAGVWVFLKRNNIKNISKNHNEIKILAQHFLGPKKSLAVVRVAGESLLIGITDNQINLLKALSLLDEELPEVTPKEFSTLLSKDENEQMENMKDHFKSSANGTNARAYNRTSAKMNKSDNNNTVESEEDEFSIKGIKDIVSNKLKNMRSI